MKLHGGLNSPFVRMCMVAAIECGLGNKVQLRPDVVAPDVPHAELVKLSPLGKVPVLELDSGEAIYDSRVIMHYFRSISGNKTLLAEEREPKYQQLTLLALAQGMADASVALRYETYARPEAKRWHEMIERHRARIKACLVELNGTRLVELNGLSLGAIAAAVALQYLDLRQLAPHWRKDCPRLAEWLAEFAKRESLAHTEPKG